MFTCAYLITFLPNLLWVVSIFLRSFRRKLICLELPGRKFDCKSEFSSSWKKSPCENFWINRDNSRRTSWFLFQVRRWLSHTRMAGWIVLTLITLMTVSCLHVEHQKPLMCCSLHFLHWMSVSPSHLWVSHPCHFYCQDMVVVVYHLTMCWIMGRQPISEGRTL